MKKLRYAAALALLAAMLLAEGAIGLGEASPRPAILSAAEVDYPPFSMVDQEGRATGFSVELMRAALAAMGRDARFRIGPWSEVRGWLERGEVQALPLVGRTPERDPLFDFTFPYMSLHGAIVVRKGTAGIERLSDLRGRQVAVMKGDNAEEFLRREERGIGLHTTPTFKNALQELSRGLHDAVFIQRLVALRLIRESGITNLRVIDVPVEGFRQDFCFAVREGDRDTLALLNEGLSLVMADGTFRHLHAKWFAALELPPHRPLVIGGDHNDPPFAYLDENGKPRGLHVEITRAIAQEIGLEVDIRLGPWPEVRQALDDGTIDAIQGMHYAPWRELLLDFTPAFTVNHYIGVVRRGEGPPPGTLEALRNLRLVVQRGDIMHDVLQRNDLEARVFLVDSQQDALRELADGRHDCALVSRIQALDWLKRNDSKALVLPKQVLLSPKCGYAVPNGRKALLAQLSEGLKILEETGEFQRIREKWLGIHEESPPGFTEVIRQVAFVLIPLLLILMMVLLWSWSLRRQVAAKTRELRLSAEVQRSMLACSPVALYSIDFEGRVQSWNPSAEWIFGWKAEEVVGRIFPAIAEDNAEAFARFRRMVRKGESFVGMEVIRKKKGGAPFYGNLSAGPIRDADGRLMGIMAAMEDITEKKEAEQALQEYSIRLEEMVEERTRALKEAQERLIRREKLVVLGQLAGGVGHELRNPLSAIKNAAYFLDMALEDPEQEVRDTLGILNREVADSERIIQSLFDYADPKAPKLRSDVNLQGMIRETLEGLTISTKIEVVADLAPDLPDVQCDPDQMRSVIRNLLENAVQSMGEVGVLRVWAAKKGEAQVVIGVSDTGEGIPGDNLDKVFEPLFTTKAKGIGLGLALCSTYVEGHGGTVEAESEEGKGTTFLVRLPVNPPDAEGEASSGSALEGEGAHA